MRNKTLITTKLERIESNIRNLNLSIGRGDRSSSYKAIDDIKEHISNIKTLLNTETQD
jgi:hypothetical protein